MKEVIMIRKIMNIVKAIILVVTLVLGVAGCADNGVEVTSTGVVIRNGIASLTFDAVSSYMDDLSRSRSILQPDTVRMAFEDGYVMEAILVDEMQMTHTRGIVKNELVNGAKILVFAYRGNTLYKKEEATVANGKITIHLPEGETFKLVFYTNNQTSAPVYTLAGGSQVAGDATSGNNAFLFKDNAILNPVLETSDAMRAEMELEITSATKLPSIVFSHLFSAVKVRLSNTGSNEVVTSFTASTPEDWAYSGARVSIENGTWNGTGDATPLFTYNNPEGTTIAESDYVHAIPKSENFKLKIPGVVIGGVTGAYDMEIPFGKPLQKGHRYVVKINVKKPVQKLYNLTVQTKPIDNLAQATISSVPLPEGGKYFAGSAVDISVPDIVTVSDGARYKFLDWTVSPSILTLNGQGHEISFNMPLADVILTANYLKQGDSWITTFKGWALGDLVPTADGKLAIAPAASMEGPGFMFGSLIGVDIQTGNIIFKPEEYTGTATHARNVPYIKTTKSPENSDSNDIAGMTDPAQGIGDICLYASQKWPENFDHKLWRLPSNNEFKNDLGGGTYAGNPAVYTFKDATGGLMQMYCWGYWYGINNSTMWRGTYGPRWTATMSTKAGNFGSGSPAAYVVALGSGVYPNYPWGRNSAFNIRCVLFDK